MYEHYFMSEVTRILDAIQRGDHCLSQGATKFQTRSERGLVVSSKLRNGRIWSISKPALPSDVAADSMSALRWLRLRRGAFSFFV